MSYIGVPLVFHDNNGSKVVITRNIEDRTAMLDNLVELIVFTPRGSFNADPDFGFEYWNHEYTNVHSREFNNGQNSIGVKGAFGEVTKQECEESIRQSLTVYEPQLKHVTVVIELNSAGVENQRRKKMFSKYMVSVTVEGIIDDGLGTTIPYKKHVSFFMEPTVKKGFK